ncbi:acyl-CoA thioesterase [Companilactobacillus pabuli]|jgi:acyl-CoA hydrolase|uniref:Acyl-CoA thioesterase n=1 Tax=Companilactobacillus pabuli TaxID=2714036 RepID=A0A7L7KUD2_9LACO|nr:acyl-CoA thioesterase [Companilactobacillus pabuli]AKP03333.1 acyl-CoA thioester hydrolase [Companilactobacillus farciminis]AKS51632.1 acyl-CoA thioester hydrolase [Companilactobacillus farciminis]MDG5112439.1 acyl-CoA thioesterase [Companilactobacillus pabuli]QMT83413.1 acyl-CoA thioesterase [Companilactobacillus pabuli]GAQ01267.1 acyl-CoA hydrolase [Companilactobacillus farciminis]
MQNLKCSDTLSISNHRVFSSDLNEHNTVFGGKTLMTIDDNSSIAASRIARIETVTASIDQVNFILPFGLQDSMCTESYVSGVGSRSIEVFTKIIGEHLKTGKRFLGLTCFSTFVVTDKNIVLPNIVPDNDEAEYVCSGYQERQSQRLKKLLEQEKFNQNISLKFPWQ